MARWHVLRQCIDLTDVRVSANYSALSISLNVARSVTSRQASPSTFVISGLVKVIGSTIWLSARLMRNNR